VTAAEAVIKPRRENGATFVNPMTSDVAKGSALMMNFLLCWEAHSAGNPLTTQITCLRESGYLLGFSTLQKTRPPAQYNANGLASPGH
jgi:hypothetical protein